QGTASAKKGAGAVSEIKMCETGCGEKASFRSHKGYDLCRTCYVERRVGEVEPEVQAYRARQPNPSALPICRDCLGDISKFEVCCDDTGEEPVCKACLDDRRSKRLPTREEVEAVLPEGFWAPGGFYRYSQGHM